MTQLGTMTARASSRFIQSACSFTLLAFALAGCTGETTDDNDASQTTGGTTGVGGVVGAGGTATGGAVGAGGAATGGAGGTVGTGGAVGAGGAATGGTVGIG